MRQKAQAMNKYIRVFDLLNNDGIAINDVMELVKSGKLLLYAMPRAYEYEAITNFDCYLDDYITRKRERLERQYVANIANIHFPSERIARARAIGDSIRERWQGQRVVRQIGVDEIISQKHKKALQSLADREGVARGLAMGLYVKSCDYENVANSDNSPRKKREAPEIRIKETQEACQFVEKKYGPLLLNKSKADVLNLVKAEMGYKQPHMETFNEWYTNCPYTRKAGNPNLAKKPA